MLCNGDTAQQFHGPIVQNFLRLGSSTESELAVVAVVFRVVNISNVKTLVSHFNRCSDRLAYCGLGISAV